MNTADLLRRARAAYVRTAASAGAVANLEQVDRGLCDVRARKGLIYVLLKNTDGIVAVYRVHKDSALRRLRRWPRELES